MPDEIVQPVVTDTPATPIPSAVEPSSATSSPVTAAVASPEPVTATPEAKPVERAKVEPPKAPATSLLADAAKEPAPAEPEVKVESVTEEPAPAPVFEAFALPEGVALDDKDVGRFTSMLGEFESQSKVDHRLVQELGQKAMDMYVAERVKDAQRAMDTWTETRQDWVKQIKADPVLGRNRFDTVMKDAARVRDLFATDRFKEMIEYTGAGDHPGMMDFVYNVAKYLEKHGLLREGQPSPAPPSRMPSGKAGPRSRYTAPKMGA